MNPQVTKSFVRLQGFVQAFAENEILAAIPPDVLARIKAENPHPFFKAYSVCHDGISKPTLLGDTARPISWLRQAVQTVTSAITKGVKFFAGHGAENDPSREALGEVVASYEKEIDGKLHHVVIGYFPKPEKVQAFDVCSQEAEWTFWDNPSGWIADKIRRMTGIALANSAFEKPAFSGAREMGFVQAFTTTESSQSNKDGESKKMEKSELMAGLMALSKVELSELIKVRDVPASLIFSIEDIRGDREFSKVFVESDKQLKEKDDQIKKLGESQKDVNDRLLKTTAQERIGKLMDEKKATKEQRDFIAKRLPACKDVSDDGLKAFLDDKLEDYQAIKVTDPKKPEIPKSNEDDSDGSEPDYTKSKDNPLLKSDL
jgi:hypothetical protein